MRARASFLFTAARVQDKKIVLMGSTDMAHDQAYIRVSGIEQASTLALSGEVLTMEQKWELTWKSTPASCVSQWKSPGGGRRVPSGPIS